MSISVIIPVYNDAARLKLCLDALAGQDPAGEAFEVIVVDNGSDSPPRGLVEGYPFCRYTTEATVGSYAARNQGLSLAAGPVIAFTDSDCIPAPDWIATGRAALKQIDDGGIVGGRIDVFPSRESDVSAVELYDTVFGLDQEKYIADTGFAATANLFTHRSVLDRVGVFDERVKAGGDLEWSHRVVAAGLPLVFAHEAVVRHPARSRLSQLITKARRFAGGRIDRRRGAQSNDPSQTAQSRAPSRLGRLGRDVGIACGLLLPPVSKVGVIYRSLRERGCSLPTVVRVCLIAWLLRLNILLSSVRAAMGAPTERR